MTPRERVEKILKIKQMLESETLKGEEIIFINPFVSGIHVYNGIKKLAESLGVEVNKIDINNSGPYVRKLWFVYENELFFEFQKEGEL